MKEAQCKQTWDFLLENLMILLKKSSERLVLKSNHSEISEKSIELAAQRCSLKKQFVKITKDLKEKPCAGASFLLADLRLALQRESGTGIFL